MSKASQSQALLQARKNIRQINEGRLQTALLSFHINDRFFLCIGMRRVCIGKIAYGGYAIQRLCHSLYCARV